MTPLNLLATTRLCTSTSVTLAARPSGVLHAFTGPLTPTGRSPRGARPVCGVRTRTLREVPLAEVRRRRVCARCHAHLVRLGKAGEVGTQSRPALLAAHEGVTAFDLAVDAWRAETPDDITRIEWLALLLVGYPATARQDVVSPNGKVTAPLDQHLAKARRRLGIVRDDRSPDEREAARLRELDDRDRVKAHRRAGWQEREDRIARLGINLADPHPRRRRSA